VPTALILLVGEQPAPNLLPTRHLRPDVAVLVHTSLTKRIADNLQRLLVREYRTVLCAVEPYRSPEIQRVLEAFLHRELREHDLVFNLTGGTTPMTLAAFCLAQRRRSPYIYFQTEGNRSTLYYYRFENSQVILEDAKELPVGISLDDYLRLYVGDFTTGDPRTLLEREVAAALRTAAGVDEVLTSVRPQGLGALEIDFVVRSGNFVGIGEVKTKGAKAGIDQLNAVAEPRYLGTYVHKFLISATPVDRNNANLARAYRIVVIEVTPQPDGTLGIEDGTKVAEMVLRELRRR